MPVFQTHFEQTTLGLLAPEDLLDSLLRDIKRKKDWKILRHYGRLVLVEGQGEVSPWTQNIWLNPQEVAITSISDASKKLRAIQRNWALLPGKFHGREKLIQESLPPIRWKPLSFPTETPTAPLGSWSLVSNHQMIYASQCASPYPHGELKFEENQQDPPSRAYLKLWEIFTLLEKRPLRGEQCYDAGASPGGWTWVLTECGALVTAVDRSPLDDRLMNNPLVDFKKGDAFSNEMCEGQEFDWIFSDVACTPEKLEEWLQRTLPRFPRANYICTLKFQGEERNDVCDRLSNIPGSGLIHLSNNKHELTWVRMAID